MNDDKLDSIVRSIASIDTTLAVQAVTLQEHIRRTELNETAIGLLAKDLEPVKTHVAAINGVVKAIGVLSFLVSILYSLWRVTR